MALQLTGGVPSGVAGTGTTAMAGTALGIAIFDLLLRNRLPGDGGLGGLAGHAGGAAAYDTAQIARLQAENAAQKEITALQIALAKEKQDKEILQLKTEFETYKACNIGAIKEQSEDIKFLQSIINLTPAISTATVHPN